MGKSCQSMSNVESTRTSTNQKTSGNQNNTKFMKFKKPSEPPQANIKCGIINKGNTCYINASLQSFSSMVELWTNISLHTDTLSPFVSSFVRTMPMLRSRKAALDPSQFLPFLQNIKVKYGKKGFDLFKQQYASEIMRRNCLQSLWNIKLLVINASKLYRMKNQCQYFLYK